MGAASQVSRPAGWLADDDGFQLAPIERANERLAGWLLRAHARLSGAPFERPTEPAAGRLMRPPAPTITAVFGVRAFALAEWAEFASALRGGAGRPDRVRPGNGGLHQLALSRCGAQRLAAAFLRREQIAPNRAVQPKACQDHASPLGQRGAPIGRRLNGARTPKTGRPIRSYGEPSSCQPAGPTLIGPPELMIQ